MRVRGPAEGSRDALLASAQVGAALHMGWVEYCAARVTAARMAADMDANPGTSLVVHNGDISYAECVFACLPRHRGPNPSWGRWCCFPTSCRLEARVRVRGPAEGSRDALLACAQVGAALHMGWVEYCAARVTAARMAADMDANPGTSLVVHNGDISYAECALLCP